METVNRTVASASSRGRWGRWFLGVAVLAAAALPARAQTSDVTPPALHSLSFTPPSVNVTAGSQSVTFTLHITDDLSGVAGFSVSLVSPSGTQSLFGGGSRVSGTVLDGVWSGDVTFPQGAENGTWTIQGVNVSDNVGNYSSYSTSVLTGSGYPTTISVTSVSDLTPPTVVGVSIDPSVDVSSGDQTLNVSLHVTDDASGVTFSSCAAYTSGNFSVVLASPSGNQSRFVWESSFTLTSGDALDGTWEATMNMPQHSEAGDWVVQSVAVKDCAGNFRYMSQFDLSNAGLQSIVTVISSSPDVTAPHLTSLSFSPITINTSTGVQTVTVRMGVKDDIAGAAFTPTTESASFFEAGVQFRSPSGNQTRYAAYFDAFTLISGTPLDGVWEGTISFPQFSEEGSWRIDFLEVKDAVRNYKEYSTTDLASNGFPTILDVIKPSLTSDGTLGPSGGTISDGTFGSRASVTVPAGVLPGPTDVAIDVFLDPLDVPIPQGFQGAVTNFVNIHFTPEPAFPLAAPGLTITLPVRTPMTPGTVLMLWKIDVVTGNLIAAIGVSGSPVSGHVNADGISATFTGIASLSTVVGLLPEPVQVGLEVKAPGTTTIKVGAGLTVNTTASEPDHPADGPWRYVLDWGDGTNFTATLTTLPTAAKPTARGKVYSKAGVYTVRLTITDKNGRSGSHSIVVTVTP